VENLINNRSEQNNSPSVKIRSVSKKSVNLHEKSNFTLGQVSKQTKNFESIMQARQVRQQKEINVAKL